MSQFLSQPFASLGLRLDLPSRPIVALNPDIFQMDIARSRGGETFRLWKGHESNAVRVTDTDKEHQQLMLLVQEAPRAFVHRIAKRGRAAPPPDFREFRVVRETDTHWTFERWTPSAMRRFLCGMDERHLFIAQVDGGTTVKDAHRMLKPREVLEADRSAPGRTERQGEWFFVALSAAESRFLTDRLRSVPYIVRRSESLGGNGRPHVADEVVRTDRERVYARGRIRHPDHKTLVLSGWRRVFRNAELRSSEVGGNGVFWVD
ncbi:MAG TPA: hypothetical protein VMU54_14110 [Planctomycetota bacterium]|nr:hypothetical protein [Planctomycetota bacterium]